MRIYCSSHKNVDLFFIFFFNCFEHFILPSVTYFHLHFMLNCNVFTAWLSEPFNVCSLYLLHFLHAHCVFAEFQFQRCSMFNVRRFRISWRDICNDSIVQHIVFQEEKKIHIYFYVHFMYITALKLFIYCLFINYLLSFHHLFIVNFIGILTKRLSTSFRIGVIYFVSCIFRCWRYVKVFLLLVLHSVSMQRYRIYTISRFFMNVFTKIAVRRIIITTSVIANSVKWSFFSITTGFSVTIGTVCCGFESWLPIS